MNPGRCKHRNVEGTSLSSRAVNAGPTQRIGPSLGAANLVLLDQTGSSLWRRGYWSDRLLSSVAVEGAGISGRTGYG